MISADITAIKKRWPNVTFATMDQPTAGPWKPFPSPVDANGNPIAMGLYLYDSESHDSTQHKAFLQREMSLHLRKAVTANYTIEGHTIGGQPVCVDAVYYVNDERGNLQQPMWCVGRHFSKAAGQEGTKTSVSLLLPGSLTF
jgi:hypothetical protein